MINIKKRKDQSVVGGFHNDNFPPDSYSDAEIIEAFFAAACAHRASAFLDSIYDWWATQDFLTPAQFNKLEEIAERN